MPTNSGPPRFLPAIFTLTFLITSSGTASPPRPEIPSQELTPQGRGDLTREFVLRWGNYVERTYGIPVRIWANRMIPTFAHADADNFREAMKRTAFESASAALSGRANRLSDAQVIRALSQPATNDASRRSEMMQKAIGSYSSDLTFTPLQPCRIVDTRVIGGSIGTGQSRSFNALTAPGGNFISQGGANNDCQALTSSEAAAVVINVTAVMPAASGYATVYPYGYSRPSTSSLNYTSGSIVNNTVVSRIPTPISSSDFTIYSFSASDYVVDIVGYYSPPLSTELVSDLPSETKTIAANSVGYINFPLCRNGYTKTGGYCYGASPFTLSAYLLSMAPNQCIFLNSSSRDETFVAMTQCAKVPGR